MSDRFFIDTNIFIYQLEAQDKRKSDVAAEIISRGITTGSGYISFQVVQECLNVVFRKAEITLDHASTRKYLDKVLKPLYRIQPGHDFYHSSLDLCVRYQYGFYDSLIIAAAHVAGCKTIYSEDLQHGQKIQNLTICNPFLS